MCICGTFTCKKKRNEWFCFDTETCISSAEVNRSGRVRNNDNQSDQSIESYVVERECEEMMLNALLYPLPSYSLIRKRRNAIPNSEDAKNLAFFIESH